MRGGAISYDWIFWCDGNQSAGLGHLNRCLGQAEALVDIGGRCLLYGDYDEVAENIIEHSNLPFIKATPIGVCGWIDCIPVYYGSRIILDSYNICAEDVSKIKKNKKVEKTILIDDFCTLDYYHCDIIINFTIGADKSLMYNSLSGCEDPQLFLGPNFYPARRWLRNVRKKRSKIAVSEVTKVLIVTGGRDNTGTTIALLELLYYAKPNVEVAVLLADDQESNNIINDWLKRFHKSHTFLHQPDLSAWYNWADICLCGGGLIKYECLFVGLPVVSMSQTKEQQIDSTNHVERGLICDLGMRKYIEMQEMQERLKTFIGDISRRQDVIDNGQALVGHSNPEIALKPFHF